MRVMLCQTNPTIGDFKNNLLSIQTHITQAYQENCDVVLFPELAIIGYPPRDLLYQQFIWDQHDKCVDKLYSFVRRFSRQITVIVGGLHQTLLSGGLRCRYNAAWILDRTYHKRVVHKTLLPTYDVFDEARYFNSDTNTLRHPIAISLENNEDIECDILICEDIWNNRYCSLNNQMLPSGYNTDPISEVHGKGPLFVLSASPFWIGKIKQTKQLLEDISLRLHRQVIFANQVGAHDDIITGGYSMVVLPGMTTNKSLTLAQTYAAKAFAEDVLIVDCGSGVVKNAQILNEDFYKPKFYGRNIDKSDFDNWTIYKALCLFLSDYCKRTGFKVAVLGLSGGIDSAVVAVIAKEVLGSENVATINMPSPYSSAQGIEDAENLAFNLNAYHQNIEITELYQQFKSSFLSGGKQKFENPVADENIQPRVRSTLLMIYSNENNALLLTTGNKSELAVGYCTLYGDLSGGLGILSDLWKTEVFKLAAFINKYQDIIPQRIIDKPPSAELRDDQKDTDTLPPYNVLDPILKCLVEQEYTVEQIVKNCGANYELVRRIDHMYHTNEFKRQQMPLGPKLQERSFGTGRRIPISKKLSRLSHDIA